MTAIQTRQFALAAPIFAGAACASVAWTQRPEAASQWLTGMLSALADGAVRCGPRTAARRRHARPGNAARPGARTLTACVGRSARRRQRHVRCRRDRAAVLRRSLVLRFQPVSAAVARMRTVGAAIRSASPSTAIVGVSVG